MSTTVGLRELRQHASDLVRRAEAGEQVLVTVSGRLVAVLGPAPARDRWRSYEDVAHILSTPTPDPHWDEDRLLISDEVADPWLRPRP